MLNRTSNRGIIMATPSVEAGVGGACYAGDKPKVRHAWRVHIHSGIDRLIQPVDSEDAKAVCSSAMTTAEKLDTRNCCWQLGSFAPQLRLRPSATRMQSSAQHPPSALVFSNHHRCSPAQAQQAFAWRRAVDPPMPWSGGLCTLLNRVTACRSMRRWGRRGGTRSRLRTCHWCRA